MKYPSLSDSEESAWAPVATPSAGNARGLLMLPQPDEEVVDRLRARRHAAARSSLGSTFNGSDKPGADLLQNSDGSFAVLSNEKIHMHSKKDFEIKSDQNMIVEIKQDEKHDGQGQLHARHDGHGQAEGPDATPSRPARA